MDYEKERREAYQAGQRALSSLREAKSHLSTARTLGIWDIFGGGSISSIAKHWKINRAREALEKAKYDLETFRHELGDVSVYLNIDIGSLLTVFDYFDSFLADVMVQTRMEDASRRIDSAICQVQNILSRIR